MLFVELLWLSPRCYAQGYSRGYSAALIAAAGSTAIIVPPGIALIIYGAITNTSVPALFAAGAVPGFLAGLSLLILNLLIFVGGMLIDAISIFYIFLPIFMPIMAHFGWDPVWFGVVMTLNLAIGQFTPPVAVNLYVTTQLANIRLEKTFKAVWPMVLVMLIVLLVIILFPSLSLFIPDFRSSMSHPLLLLIAKICLSAGMVITITLVAERISTRFAGVLLGFPLGAGLTFFFMNFYYAAHWTTCCLGE